MAQDRCAIESVDRFWGFHDGREARRLETLKLKLRYSHVTCDTDLLRNVSTSDFPLEIRFSFAAAVPEDKLAHSNITEKYAHTNIHIPERESKRRDCIFP